MPLTAISIVSTFFLHLTYTVLTLYLHCISNINTNDEGNHLSVVEGVTYLFVNEENKETFDADPGKYLPAFGGYCAYGVAVGKKFVGDPDVWRIVNGKLYLNLDTSIQTNWIQDIDGNIVKAEKNWIDIEDVPASEL